MMMTPILRHLGISVVKIYSVYIINIMGFCIINHLTLQL